MHGGNLADPSTTRIEQNAQPSLRRSVGLTVFAEDESRRVRAHRMPAWKLLLGRDAPLEVQTEEAVRTGWALLVPPGVNNVSTSHGSYTALFVDPGHVVGDVGQAVIDLGPTQGMALVEEVNDGLGDNPVPVGLSGLMTADDQPLARALRRIGPDSRVDEIAASLAVSPQHLRRLIRAATGSTYGEIVRWARLRHAIEQLGRHSIAAAAAASGFSDQAHLTRVSASMIGRTPGTLHAADDGQHQRFLIQRA